MLEWTVKFTVSESGTFTYFVTGVYENGYTDSEKTLAVIVNIENVPSDGGNDNNSNSEASFLESLTGFFRRLIEFFKALFAMFGIMI